MKDYKEQEVRDGDLVDLFEKSSFDFSDQGDQEDDRVSFEESGFEIQFSSIIEDRNDKIALEKIRKELERRNKSKKID